MKLKAIASTPTKLYGRNSGKNCSPTKINARLSVIEPDLNEDPIDCWRTNGVDHVPSPSTSFLFLFLKPQNPDIQNHLKPRFSHLFEKPAQNQLKPNTYPTADLEQTHKYQT